MDVNMTELNLLDLIDSISWSADERVRVFWLCASKKSRSLIAKEIERLDTEHAIFPVILRDTLFVNANAILADFNKLVSDAQKRLEAIPRSTISKLSIVILSNEEFSLPQVSSPIVLPAWFPVLGGCETYLRISDLFQQAEVDLLNGDSARIDQIASLLYEIESTLVSQFVWIAENNSKQLKSLVDVLKFDDKGGVSVESFAEIIKSHVESVGAPRAYRPSAKALNSLLSRMISQVLKSSPDKLGALATKVAVAYGAEHGSILKPTLFSVMMRPTGQFTIAAKNWHSAFMSFYQSYQLMNAAAHAGEYPKYSISLILANSQDLVRFLSDFSNYVSALSPELTES
ncbi:hypothetical protein [Pseudomonas kilonensis]|uniref:hypothetical protein n=1 Tax=Pseudomonas kilonensis TaxID=132476 RepID=UPI00209E49D4|nr:hypothetical protein [Pseudomonas kilonensis]MCP1456117.1 hypothetical protein [Pseudomonas kilonensis]